MRGHMQENGFENLICASHSVAQCASHSVAYAMCGTLALHHRQGPHLFMLL